MNRSNCVERPPRVASHVQTCVKRCAGAAGFTLIELLTVVAMVATLAAVALPGFEGQLQRARRADALVAMVHVQVAQERWRGNGARYGSLAEIGSPALSASGHYQLAVRASHADGYDLLASAIGSQARDTRCRHLALVVDGANVAYASGSDVSVGNPAPVNRACWNL
jgi:type IV pilus assembly protein PilE